MTSKAKLQSVSRQLVAKSATWNQVAKQLSGMSGKITVKNDKITVKQAFEMLGVKTTKNTYTAKDFVSAWANELKVNTNNAPTCLISKALPVVGMVGDNEYKLFALTEKGYKAVKQHKLCRLVKAEDKVKGSDDVIVSAKAVIDGLVQSIMVSDTMKKIDDDEKAVNELIEAFINEGTPDAPKWTKVYRKHNAVWSKTAPKEEVKIEEKPAPKAPKKERKPKNKK